MTFPPYKPCSCFECFHHDTDEHTHTTECYCERQKGELWHYPKTVTINNPNDNNGCNHFISFEEGKELSEQKKVESRGW